MVFVNLDHELAVLIFSPDILWKHTLRDYEGAPDFWHCGFISHGIHIFVGDFFLNFLERSVADFQIFAREKTTFFSLFLSSLMAA